MQTYHYNFRFTPPFQIAKDLATILRESPYEYARTYSDEKLCVIQLFENLYRTKLAMAMSEAILNKSQDITYRWFIETTAAYLSYAFDYTSNRMNEWRTNYGDLNKAEQDFLISWLKLNGFADIVMGGFELYKSIKDALQASFDILNPQYYKFRFLLKKGQSLCDFDHERDLCKPADWDNRKHQLKIENIRQLENNHFGKYFYDNTKYTNRFEIALFDSFCSAATQYLEEDFDTDINAKIDEFFYLQSMYCLLHGEDPVPPCFREQSQPAAASSPAATAAEESQQPTVSPEERKRSLDLYVGLAQTSMKLPDVVLQAIRKVFDPGDEDLWGKIAEDRQNPIPYTDYDHTDLTPFFNLLGVLKRKGRLPKRKEWTALLDRLPNNFHSKNKNAIKIAVTNGSRNDPKPLACSIEQRLNQQ